jgi:hypothetical protein
MWPLVVEVVGGSFTAIVLGAYVLAYGAIRLEWRHDPSNRCPSIYELSSKRRRGEFRCDYVTDHEGPHHAMTGGAANRDLWWVDDKMLWTKPE